MSRLLTNPALRLLLVLAVAFVWLVPGRPALAASITAMAVSTDAPFLIAGRPYAIYIKTDRAKSTDMTTTVSYAPGTSDAWVQLNKIDKDGTIPFTVVHILVDFFDKDYKSYDAVIPFTIPINPNVTSARLRAAAHFDPLIGAASSSVRTLGPYDIKQPGQITDVRATANDDGTVTLRWYDNTNMEKYYRITRVGSDGTKTFYLENTTDHIGLLTFRDETTDRGEERFYQYTVTPVADPVYGSYYADFFDSGRAFVITKAAPSAPPGDLIVGDVRVNWGAGGLFERLPFDFAVPAHLLDKDKQSKRAYDAAAFELGKLGPIAGIELNEALKNKLSVTGVTLDRTSVALHEGETVQLTATVQPATALNKTVFWSSSNPAVATVDATGRVKAVQPGQATIRVQTEDGAFVAASAVTVTEAPAGASQFPDVPATDWARDDIAAAVKLGIIQGYPDGTFRPNNKITHAEMIVTVVRAAGLDTSGAGKTMFADDGAIPEWAKPAVAAAESAGIIFGGIVDNRFLPQTNSTRAEAASAIVRMLYK